VPSHCPYRRSARVGVPRRGRNNSPAAWNCASKQTMVAVRAGAGRKGDRTRDRSHGHAMRALCPGTRSDEALSLRVAFHPAPKGRAVQRSGPSSSLKDDAGVRCVTRGLAGGSRWELAASLPGRLPPSAASMWLSCASGPRVPPGGRSPMPRVHRPQWQPPRRTRTRFRHPRGEDPLERCYQRIGDPVDEALGTGTGVGRRGLQEHADEN
jgi:hypothetical protein